MKATLLSLLFMLCLSIALQAHAQDEPKKTTKPKDSLVNAKYLIIGIGGEGDMEKLGVETAKNFHALLTNNNGVFIKPEDVTLDTDGQLSADGIKEMVRQANQDAGKRPLVVMIFATAIADFNGDPHIVVKDTDLRQVKKSATSLHSLTRDLSRFSDQFVMNLVYTENTIPMPLRTKRNSGRESRNLIKAQNAELRPVPVAIFLSRNAIPEVEAMEEVDEDAEETEAVKHDITQMQFPVFNASDVVRLDLKHSIIPTIAGQLKPLKLYREITFPNGMRFRRIAPGSFVMGSGGEAWKRPKNEAPRRQVHITKPFYINTHEITYEQFEIFVNETRYTTEAEGAGSSNTWRENEQFEQQTDKHHPVVYVSRKDAEAYMAWLSEKYSLPFVLPSEAQWEYAARGGAAANRSWNLGPGRGIDTNWANYQNRYRGTTPVGRFAPNTWGLYDMHGNVMEWTRDNMHAYVEDDTVNPDHSESNGAPVMRGGAWHSGPTRCHLARRLTTADALDTMPNASGFRVIIPFFKADDKSDK